MEGLGFRKHSYEGDMNNKNVSKTNTATSRTLHMSADSQSSASPSLVGPPLITCTSAQTKRLSIVYTNLGRIKEPETTWITALDP